MKVKVLTSKILSRGAFLGIAVGTLGLILNLFAFKYSKFLTLLGVIILTITPLAALMIVGISYLKEKKFILFLASIGTLILLLIGIFFSRS